MSETTPRGIRTSRPQGVAFVELFFDLVFVFAITQLTAETAGQQARVCSESAIRVRLPSAS